MVHAGATDRDALQRMQLADPKNLGEKMETRLVGYALSKTAV
jgi:hypothetical protein